MTHSYTSFLVLSTQGSGSTLLCELLGSHPDVFLAKELFKFFGEGRNLDVNRYDPATGPVKEFLKQFYQQKDSSLTARGFKLMLDQHRQYSEIAKFISDNELSIIYLERTNLLKQHVSRQAAQVNQLYHSEQQGKREKIVLKLTSLLEQLTQSRKDRDVLRSMASHYNALTLIYEDIIADVDTALDKALSFLELKSTQMLTSPLVKIHDPDLNRSLLNYPDVCQMLKNTGFSHYLDPLEETGASCRKESTFIHIPKAAGSSIESALYGTYGKVSHRSAEEKYQQDPVNFDKSFSFAFVRNPYDRFVSSFVYLQHGGRNEIDREWAEQNLSEYADFELFVLALQKTETRSKILNWMHFRPQHEFICNADGKIIVDFVGKFENLEADFCKVAERLGNNSTLPHLNSVERADYESYYTAQTRAIVYSLYKEDFDLFNYEI